MRIAALLGLLALGACGADGPPLRPGASVGIGDGVVDVDGAFGVTEGAVSIGIGL